MADNSNKTTFEMFWDCTACGTEKLLGVTHRYCPHCGSPQDPEARYFPADNEKIAIEDHALTGTDLTCPSCSTPNSNLANNCLSCGGSLDEQKLAAVRDDVVTDEHSEYSGQTLASLKAEQNLKQQEDAKQAVRPRSGKAKWVAGTGTVGGVAALMLWSTAAEVTVTGHNWSRSISIEQYKSVQDSDWCDDIPNGSATYGAQAKCASIKKCPMEKHAIPGG